MTTVYLESSAAVKLMVKEKETDALREYLRQLETEAGRVVSSSLLETELRRAAIRYGAPQTTATAVLDRVDVFDLTRSNYTSAGILPGDHLRALDAIHVAAALSINADVLVSYDERQLAAAEAVGMHVHSPV